MDNRDTNAPEYINKRGGDLQPGDSVCVWWAEGGATLYAISPYLGPLAHLFPDGAQTGVFAAPVKSGSLAMTIDNGAFYRVRAVRGPMGAYPA